MTDLITELHALAQRMAAAGETDEPVTVSLAAEEIGRLRSEIEMRKLQVTGAAKVIQEEKNDNSKLREERDQLKAILQDVNTSDYRFSVEQLSAHDAEVIEQFARELGVFDPEYDDQEYIEVPRYAIKEYANQLRQQAKEVQS